MRSLILKLVYVSYFFQYHLARRVDQNGSYQPPCYAGVMKIEEWKWTPSAVPSPGYVYYTLKATVCDSENARKLAKSDLQLTIELLSPMHGVIPMPCSQGLGSCIKPLSTSAPYFARMLANGQTEIYIDNKEICLFDAGAMGELYASGQYRITAKFLEAGSHKALACYRFETTVVHGTYPCRCGDEQKNT